MSIQPPQTPTPSPAAAVALRAWRGAAALPGHGADRLRAWRSHAGGAWADRARRRRILTTGAAFSTIAVAVAVFFALFQWDWLRGPVAAYASAQTGREVRILGHLHVHPFSLSPTATVDGLQIGNPKWIGHGRTADLGRSTVRVKLLPLFFGQVNLPLVDIEHPQLDLYADKTGRNNWTLGKGGGKPAALPPIQHFILRGGHIHMVDEQRRLVLAGTVNTTESAGASGAAAFHLIGQGTLNRQPITTTITGGPLVNVHRDRPYPFNLDIHAGVTRISAHGTITRPFNLGDLNTQVSVSGRDLADLYVLTGIVLPNSPAYSLQGDVDRDGETYIVKRFGGHVGSSDLHGTATLEKRGGRRFLKADASSRSLTFADLGALFGGPQAGKATRAEARAAAKAQIATGHILPDATLDPARMRSMDADVRYRAESVVARPVPLRKVALHLTLDHGVLKLDPFTISLPRGQVGGRVRLDARKATPVTDVDVAMTDVPLQDVMPRPQGIVPMDGVMEGRAVLHGAGNSVHRAAAASDGRVAVAIPAGKVRQALAELMGVDLVPGLFQLLAKDPKQTDLRCAVAEFDVKGGVMTARRMVFDTGVVVAAGQGTVNLDTETVNLTIKGQPKKPRLVHVIAPFHVRGQLARPSFGIDTGPVIAQAGIGVALGAFLSPLAAIVPFLSAGGGHDADCAALLAEVRASGAPVKRAAIASAPPVRH